MALSRARFSASNRLRKSKEFGRVFAAPVRSADRYFTVLARPGEAERPRLGLTVSKRAARRAVDRNRIKRIAREAFRTRPDLPAWDFVVLARPGVAAADNPLLRHSLDAHFERLKRRALRASAPTRMNDPR